MTGPKRLTVLQPYDGAVIAVLEYTPWAGGALSGSNVCKLQVSR